MRKLLPFLILFILIGCQSSSLPHPKAVITTAQGKTVKTYFAISLAEQEQGLSGIKEDQFADNEGMLFYYSEGGIRQFWMPDTYFDLDLFYLDGNFRVLDIIRKLKHHQGRNQSHLIPRARAVWSWHVLEMRADSPIAKEIQIGDQLKIEYSEELKKALPAL